MPSFLPDQFQSYKPSIYFNIDSKNFLVKIAETEEELLGAFKLRNNILYKKWTGKLHPSGLDIDKYDSLADHLIVIQKSTNQVVGTYRFIAKKLHSQFYNENLFHLKGFLDKKIGNKIEVGRACTHQSLRGSIAIHHIWLGLAKYFRETLSRYMFGRVGISKSSPEYIVSVYKTLVEKKLVTLDTDVYPLEDYKIPNFKKLFSEVQTDEKSLLKLPRLFLWYLNIGAEIHGAPIFYPKFKSYYFFMSLDFKKIKNPKLVNQYKDAVYLKDNL